jgi:hypothetical protein
MVAGGDDDDLLSGDEVDETVLVVDPPGPGSGQVVLEWFGLADAGEEVAALSCSRARYHGSFGKK